MGVCHKLIMNDFIILPLFITCPLFYCSGVLGELSAMVQGSPAFQGRLGPALIQTYSAVGFFEGLDVDKEDFDKYSARYYNTLFKYMHDLMCLRYDICQLLTFLWSRMDCRESIIQQTGTKRFELFLGAIFDTLLYQLNDSLLRITNIHKIEAEKENGTITIISIAYRMYMYKLFCITCIYVHVRVLYTCMSTLYRWICIFVYL